MKRLLFLCCAAACLTGAYAAPDAPAMRGSDPVLQLLQANGLVHVEPLARQVREATSELVVAAMNFIGLPYRRGGGNEEGFDCSGFTRHIFGLSLGLTLPRRSDEQARSSALTSVAREELKPGDLVFFNTLKRAFSHVGIYVGEGKFIHSPRTGGDVRIEDMRNSYWTNRFNGARRVDAGVLPARESAPAAQPN